MAGVGMPETGLAPGAAMPLIETVLGRNTEPSGILSLTVVEAAMLPVLDTTIV
jgi:hypothetical protein